MRIVEEAQARHRRNHNRMVEREERECAGLDIYRCPVCGAAHREPEDCMAYKEPWHRPR